MKKIIILFFLILVCHKIMAQDFNMQLVIWAKDGTRVVYILEEKPKITFTETDLVVTVKSIEVNYALENLAHFTYESSDNTAIKILETDETLFKLKGESLFFPALKSNSSIAIYTVNGALVMKKTIQDNGEYALSLSNLNSGVYLIDVNGLTYKIIKR